VRLLKSIPIDFGQANVKHTTKGKIIALALIPFHKNNISAAKPTALDVGCRDGHFSRMLKEKGYTVVSIDIECHYENCQEVDANKPLPFPDNSFDVIWCSEVIEHLEKPQQIIAEFKRVLKPEGKAVLTTPNSKFWLYKVLALFGLTPQKVQNPTHLHFFGEKDIKALKPSVLYGFFPYFIFKFRITRLLNLLTPTFVFVIQK